MKGGCGCNNQSSSLGREPESGNTDSENSEPERDTSLKGGAKHRRSSKTHTKTRSQRNSKSRSKKLMGGAKKGAGVSDWNAFIKNVLAELHLAGHKTITFNPKFLTLVGMYRKGRDYKTQAKEIIKDMVNDKNLMKKYDEIVTKRGSKGSKSKKSKKSK